MHFNTLKGREGYISEYFMLDNIVDKFFVQWKQDASGFLEEFNKGFKKAFGDPKEGEPEIIEIRTHLIDAMENQRLISTFEERIKKIKSEKRRAFSLIAGKKSDKALNAKMNDLILQLATHKKNYIASILKLKKSVDTVATTKRCGNPADNFFFQSLYVLKKLGGPLSQYQELIDIAVNPSGKTSKKEKEQMGLVSTSMSNYLVKKVSGDFQSGTLKFFRQEVSAMPDFKGTPVVTNILGSEQLQNKEKREDVKEELYSLSFDFYYSHIAHLYEIFVKADLLGSMEAPHETNFERRNKLLSEVGLGDLGSEISQKYLNEMAKTLGYHDAYHLYQNYRMLERGDPDNDALFKKNKSDFILASNEEQESIKNPLERLMSTSREEYERVHQRQIKQKKEASTATYYSALRDAGNSMVSDIKKAQVAIKLLEVAEAVDFDSSEVVQTLGRMSSNPVLMKNPAIYGDPSMRAAAKLINLIKRPLGWVFKGSLQREKNAALLENVEYNSAFFGRNFSVRTNELLSKWDKKGIKESLWKANRPPPVNPPSPPVKKDLSEESEPQRGADVDEGDFLERILEKSFVKWKENAEGFLEVFNEGFSHLNFEEILDKKHNTSEIKKIKNYLLVIQDAQLELDRNSKIISNKKSSSQQVEQARKEIKEYKNKYVKEIMKLRVEVEICSKSRDFKLPIVNNFFFQSAQALDGLSVPMSQSKELIDILLNPSGKSKFKKQEKIGFFESKVSNYAAEKMSGNFKSNALKFYRQEVLKMTKNPINPKKINVLAVAGDRPKMNELKKMLPNKYDKLKEKNLKEGMYGLSFEFYYLQVAKLYDTFQKIERLAAIESKTPNEFKEQKKQRLARAGLADMDTKDGQKYLNNIARMLGYQDVIDLHNNYANLQTEWEYDKLADKKEQFISKSTVEELEDDPLDKLMTISKNEEERIHKLYTKHKTGIDGNATYHSAVNHAGKMVKSITATQRKIRLAELSERPDYDLGKTLQTLGRGSESHFFLRHPWIYKAIPMRATKKLWGLAKETFKKELQNARDEEILSTLKGDALSLEQNLATHTTPLEGEWAEHLKQKDEQIEKQVLSQPTNEEKIKALIIKKQKSDAAAYALDKMTDKNSDLYKLKKHESDILRENYESYEKVFLETLESTLSICDLTKLYGLLTTHQDKQNELYENLDIGRTALGDSFSQRKANRRLIENEIDQISNEISARSKVLSKVTKAFNEQLRACIDRGEVKERDYPKVFHNDARVEMLQSIPIVGGVVGGIVDKDYPFLNKMRNTYLACEDLLDLAITNETFKSRLEMIKSIKEAFILENKEKIDNPERFREHKEQWDKIFEINLEKKLLKFSQEANKKEKEKSACNPSVTFGYDSQRRQQSDNSRGVVTPEDKHPEEGPPPSRKGP